MTPALSLALTAIAAARQVLRARTPGTPAGDADEVHEDNTFNLPEGRPIRRAFKRFAKRQLKKTLSSLPAIGAPLPLKIQSVTDWTNPMASAMTPLVGLYWDEAGKTTRARLGLDPDAWEVHDPHLHDVIKQQAFRFCQSTNETTDKELGEALDQLRQEFIEGLVTSGETIPELARRVQSVFSRMSKARAETVARTEAARAVHAASLISAKESGVVAGKKWLLSGDACPYCHEVAARFPGGTGLDSAFSDDGKGTDYSSCPAPPLHPNCRCSITYVLTEEYEQLLAEHGPPEPERYDYDGGSLGPEPKRRKIAKPRPAPKPQPAAYDFQAVGSLPDSDIAGMRKAIESLPKPALDAMHKFGTKFVLSEDMASYDPVVAAMQPRGWSAGKTFANCAGAYDGDKKTVVVCKKYLDDGRQVESIRRDGKLRHETGHAFDHALGRASELPVFREAYAKDIARLTDQEKVWLAYYLQPGNAGPREAFAEVFAQHYGGMDGGADYTSVRTRFPDCLKLIKEWTDKGAL